MDCSEIIDKQYLAMALGYFLNACLEHVLGRTKFKSLLGLATAVVWFIFRTIVTKTMSVFKKGERNGSDSSNKTS